MVIAASIAVDVATVVAGVVAVIGIVGPIRGYLTRTVGRRFDLYRRLGRLGVGAQQSFFEEVIGEAPAIRRQWTVDLPDYEADIDDDDDFPLVERTFTEELWVDPLFYAQTVADEDGTVLGFSITTRKRRFAPRFAAPLPVATHRWVLDRLTGGRWRMPALAHVRLGRTRFAEVSSGEWGVPKVRSMYGARRYTYSEAWSFGNPGHYSDYVCTASSASDVGGYPEGMQHLDWPGKHEDPDEGYAPSGPDEDPRLATWIETVRGRAVVTTWTVVQFPLSVERWPPDNFGPHGDEVRMLP
jgi:hypothetical protein